MIAEIEPAELIAWRQDPGREPPIVVDVREAWEFDHCRIGDSRSLPLRSLPQAPCLQPTPNTNEPCRRP